MLCFDFFFQAEDGIRVGHVTGVQTCALPILFRLNIQNRSRNTSTSNICNKRKLSRKQCASRSEERRVGKSVDLGGRRIINKKKEEETKVRGKEKTMSGGRVNNDVKRGIALCR